MSFYQEIAKKSSAPETKLPDEKTLQKIQNEIRNQADQGLKECQFPYLDEATRNWLKNEGFTSTKKFKHRQILCDECGGYENYCAWHYEPHDPKTCPEYTEEEYWLVEWE